jgi:hypothetical protein
MSRSDTDPRLSPRAVRLAQPLVERFVASPFCPAEHAWHARSTLPLLALYIALDDDPRSERVAWESLEPDALLSASLDISPDEHAFIRDLLDVSAAFYAFLATQGELSWSAAEPLRGRLAQLALGLTRRAA